MRRFAAGMQWGFRVFFILGVGFGLRRDGAALGYWLNRGFLQYGIASWVRAAVRPEFTLGLTFGLVRAARSRRQLAGWKPALR